MEKPRDTRSMDPSQERMPDGPATGPKTFVLCFDGTGNKFCGDESDSNVLKIFRMLDRDRGHQFHYYQPGIGTYVTSTTLSSSGYVHRIRSAYLKAKDSAIGSSFDQHVMGGYKFLMRYYTPGDDIYFFGFSRGSYIARFLAEMLDYIGLLEAGNEELIRFAWKTFAKWQQRRGGSEEDEEEKKRLFRYMKAFRETFSRPVSRIRFMGLFDTVNSVPRFESAWMQRSKFPYTARSSALVIRHAVGIDERRAKFRQDLISQGKPTTRHHFLHHSHHYRLTSHKHRQNAVPEILLNNQPQEPDGQAKAEQYDEKDRSTYRPRSSGGNSGNKNEPRYRSRSPGNESNRRLNLAIPQAASSAEDVASAVSATTNPSLLPPSNLAAEGDELDQDIEEVWFPGGHADIGGGWKMRPGEKWALSHGPLVWMVQEAAKAGLAFDERKVKQFECSEEYSGDWSPINEFAEPDWNLCVEDEEPSNSATQQTANGITVQVPESREDRRQRISRSRFHEALELSSREGVLHDCLNFREGLKWTSVLSWRIMEYLPFRRMDLQEDGSWKPIRWPLPCGEVRDIPPDAQIHVSAIRRLKANPKYRPGNLIVGGGGRGVRVAPEEYGIGEWVVHKNEGDPVRETYIRKSPPPTKENHH